MTLQIQIEHLILILEDRSSRGSCLVAEVLKIYFQIQVKQI